MAYQTRNGNAGRAGPSTGYAVELDHFDFAIICALPREFDAVEASLDEIYDDQTPVQNENDANFYKTGRIGPFNIVLACLSEMGKESAASAASSLQISFPSITLTLVVGICGGVPFPAPDTELIMGDVVISHQVLKFDFGRQYPDRFEPRGGVQDTLDRSNRSIRSLISGLQINSSRVEFQEMHTRYLQDVGEKGSIWQYPGMDQDRLFPSSFDLKDTYETADLEDLVQRQRLTGADNPKPRLHFGPIGSTDTVMKSAKHRDDLAQGSQLVGFEMEGSGVCNNLSCVIIKGVCDYADSHKTKVWQDYAAASAACATKSFLEFMATKKFGSFVYCKTLQIDSRTSSVTSQSVGQWHIPPISSKTTNVDQHIQSVDEGLRHIADGIPNPLLRRTLISAASQAIHNSRTEMRRISKNQIFQSVPHTSVFGKIIFRTQIIEHTISLGDESSVQSETRTSFTFHPAPWLLRLGVRYGLKAMAVNHHKTWQYNISPVNVRPDDSLVFHFCEMGNTEAVRELLERQQASVHDVDSNGWTLLHFATFRGHLDLAKFLILQNADKEACSYLSRTPAGFIRPTSKIRNLLEMLYLFEDCIEFCEPHAAGWEILCRLEFDDQGDLDYQAYQKLCKGVYLFLLERLREEVTAGIDLFSIENAQWWAAGRGDTAGMDLIFQFDTQKLIHSHYEECPLDDVNARWLYLQFLAEKGVDIRTRLHGETPTSRCLEFSDSFLHWRDDARLLFPVVDQLIERETSGEPAPRLRGWSFHLLLDLFSLDLHEHLKDHQYKESHIYMGSEACGDMIGCLECRYARKVSFFHGYDDGLFIEPWWVELKVSIKNRECLCSIDDVVRDGRDRNNMIHISCRFEDIDSDSGSQSSHSSWGSEYFSDAKPTQTQETDSQANSDTNDNAIEDLTSDPDISHTLGREVSPPDQRGIHWWGDVIPFQYWAEHCYEKYGGWRNEYERLEYYCFKCLALFEGWDAEYEEVCEYLETLSEEAEGDDSDSEMVDSGSDESD